MFFAERMMRLSREARAKGPPDRGQACRHARARCRPSAAARANLGPPTRKTCADDAHKEDGRKVTEFTPADDNSGFVGLLMRRSKVSRPLRSCYNVSVSSGRLQNKGLSGQIKPIL